jgi:hypothetical protein
VREENIIPPSVVSRVASGGTLVLTDGETFPPAGGNGGPRPRAARRDGAQEAWRRVLGRVAQARAGPWQGCARAHAQMAQNGQNGPNLPTLQPKTGVRVF